MKERLKGLLWILLALLFQIFICNQINIFGYGSVFAFVVIFITAPTSIKPIRLMLIAFVVGLIVDIFSHSYGINACVSTIIAVSRKSFLKLFFAKEDTEYNVNIFIKFSSDYYKYIIFTVTIYCFLVFLMQAMTFRMIVIVLQKTLVSAIATSVFIFFIQSFILKKYNER